MESIPDYDIHADITSVESKITVGAMRTKPVRGENLRKKTVGTEAKQAREQYSSDVSSSCADEEDDEKKRRTI